MKDKTPFIIVKNQDGEAFTINLDNVMYVKDYPVGLSSTVTFRCVDGTNVTTLLTADKMRQLKKMVNAIELS